MARMCEYFGHRPGFHDAAGIHDGSAIGDFGLDA
jgi:hypothetical protein